MKATCPNDPEHKQFLTTAHLMQEWVVDEHGNFVEHSLDLETSHGPDSGNIWTCYTCGAQAEVED